ncbi:MAG: glycosyltransferase [Bacteroidia bacterium]|nr:glycosyltransferase [Bacteroidia bacterium]
MSKAKKVLYISYDGMTDPLGQSQVIPYLIGLSKEGYHITILSFEKRRKYIELGKYIQQLLNGAGIEWVTQFFNVRPPFLSKLYDQRKMKRIAGRLNKDQKFDLIHCRSYVAAASGLKLFLRYKIPFLFDMRGFWVDERIDSGHWNINNPLYRFLYKRYKKKEKKYFSKSAYIISLTQKGKDELINTYEVPSDKISVIPCCVDLEHFDYKKINEEQKREARKQLRITSEKKVLSYLGSLGGWYMTDEMLDFFLMMKAKIPEAVFLFITHDDRELIVAKASAKGISAEDIYVQPAGRKDVPLYLSLSDWSIFFIKDLYSKKASSPTKQGEIMAMGIPVICNDIGDTGKIIRESGYGIVINDFNEAAYERIAGSLNSLLQIDKSNIRKSAFEYYDLKKGIEKYKKVYQQLIS